MSIGGGGEELGEAEEGDDAEGEHRRAYLRMVSPIFFSSSLTGLATRS
jgi:hypothetical protein